MSSYAWTMSEACKRPVRDPFQLLVLGVLLRWKEDVAEGRDDTECGEEWFAAADVPTDWWTRAEA